MKQYVKMVLFLTVLCVVGAYMLTAVNLMTRSRIEGNKKRERFHHIVKSLQILPESVQQKLKTDAKLSDPNLKEGFARHALTIERTEAYMKQEPLENLNEIFTNKLEVLEINIKNESLINYYKGKDFITSKPAYKENYYVFKGRLNDNTFGYSFEVAGAGFWDRVAGYMSLKEGLRDVYGITFYDHKETPGLGARIEEGWFQAQFIHHPKSVFAGQGAQLPDFVISPQQGTYLGDVAQKPVNAVDAITGASETSRAIDRFIDVNLIVLFDVLARNLSNENVRQFLDPKSMETISNWKSYRAIN